MVQHRHTAIRAELESRIHSGELQPGDRMPTEAQLRETFGVSRSVAQRVLNDLAAAGLVVRQRGRGTHVAEGAQQVNVLRSVDPRLASANIPGTMELISAEVVPMSDAEVVLPGLSPDHPVSQLVRVRSHPEDRPIVVEIAAVPFDLAPRLLHESPLERVKIRDYLARNQVSISRSRMYFEPVLLEQRHASLLKIEAGVPVLRRRRLMWQANGDIAESTAYYLRPNALDFYVEYSEPDSSTP